MQYECLGQIYIPKTKEVMHVECIITQDPKNHNQNQN